MENTSAKGIALRMLSRRAHSEYELRDKLRKRGVSESEAEDVCTWLREMGFLNDAQYSFALTEHFARKGYGRGRIVSEFRRRGLERELWDEALEGMPEADPFIDRFLASRLRNPGDAAERRRLSEALLRRGFSLEEIRSAFLRIAEKAEDYN